jgi:hypothetical protein
MSFEAKTSAKKVKLMKKLFKEEKVLFQSPL